MKKSQIILGISVSLLFVLSITGIVSAMRVDGGTGSYWENRQLTKFSTPINSSINKAYIVTEEIVYPYPPPFYPTATWFPSPTPAPTLIGDYYYGWWCDANQYWAQTLEYTVISDILTIEEMAVCFYGEELIRYFSNCQNYYNAADLDTYNQCNAEFSNWLGN